ncbi:STAS domain-containing protein [Actinomadura sp. 7K507]|uniref:STAS domain-containing protein n=1 Tax=Actinomadura sp. 7K507 TaxID=2530365 RepID=UPI00104FC9EE|nr:STAS domain-containing protein [Actinomadura sp. 7K507]TDC88176.1 anti-sigma factor antagonist [Actinomadura sp. 7K507]
MAVMPDASSSGPNLGVDVEQSGPWLTAQLHGELDWATVSTLLERVGPLIAQEVPPQIALDLSGVTFSDSSGINAFIRLWKHASAAGGELVLLRPRPRMAELLTRTGVDRHILVLTMLPV